MQGGSFARATVLCVLGAALAAGCATPTRYVVLSGDHPLRERAARDRRAIWVAEPEAAAASALVGLDTLPAVRRYGAVRPARGPAVEALLFAVLSADWPTAQQVLQARRDELPAYLRALARADLASEARPAPPQGELLRLYQDAYDAQQAGPGRAVVALRVRQLRYGR